MAAALVANYNTGAVLAARDWLGVAAVVVDVQDKRAVACIGSIDERDKCANQLVTNETSLGHHRQGSTRRGSQRVADTKSGFLRLSIRNLYEKSRDAWVTGPSLSYEEALTSFELIYNGHLTWDELTLGHALPFEKGQSATQIIDFGMAPAQNGHFPNL